MKSHFLFCLLMGCSFLGSVKATNYYINTSTGKNSNKGTSPSKAWQTVEMVNDLMLQPGDSVLFASGQKFTGQLSLLHVTGADKHPVVITSYPYQGSVKKPILDAGNDFNAILIQNSSFIEIKGLEITAVIPKRENNSEVKKEEMRCGILVQVTSDALFQNIRVQDVVVHDVFLMRQGFTRSAAETKSANGTQGYGWGIRFINNTKNGLLKNIEVLRADIYNVCHTGLKITARTEGIQDVTIAYCKVHQTGGPGMQFSGLVNGHIHHNQIDHSGSTADSRNWGRGSGLWTWGCSNILIENNRFENANGPGDSAGIHIDFNCNDVVVQYNLSANNAGGFCEILGNNYNCAYRYNISINDGFREKGVKGAFQEGKIFWLSGYQGDVKPKAGPYNSYFYNNSIYVAAGISPKIAISSSTDGVLIANNIFYFEDAARSVTGDQKAKEVDEGSIPRILFRNNLFLRPDNWPSDLVLQDSAPLIGDPLFTKKGGVQLVDYIPLAKKAVLKKGILIPLIPKDTIGLRIGLKVTRDILGNPVHEQPGLGAIELPEKD